MKTLSPKHLARSLGVSESSVKRWVDDGALAAMRTAGGHRRIAVSEAVRFVRKSGVPVPRPDLIVGAAPVPLAGAGAAPAAEEMGERFFALLERDDAASARAMLLALYVSGWSVAALCDGPMRLALEKIGTLWKHGPAGIVIEHRATDTCVRALAEMRALFAPPKAGAPAALGGAPGGDPYILPSLMAATVLADLGYRDHNLGPDAPAAAFAHAVDQHRPRIAWLAMSVAPSAHRAAAVLELAAQVARRGGTLILGGRGMPPFPPTPALLSIHSMAELAAFALGARTAG